MFDALIERPGILAIVIVSLAVINYGLGLWGERLVSRQHIIERASARITIEGSSRSRRSRIAWPFVTAVPIAVLAFYLDSVGRQILCGGYLIMQVMNSVASVEAFLRERALLGDGAADGRVRLSLRYEYLSAATRTLAAGVLSAIIAVLFNNLSFAAGAVFLLATAAGWYRRSSQSRVSGAA